MAIPGLQFLGFLRRLHVTFYLNFHNVSTYLHILELDLDDMLKIDFLVALLPPI